MIFHFIEKVLTLRLKYPFSITSWIRTIEHNRIVGGVTNSNHITGEGMDIVFEPKTLKNINFEKDCDIEGITAIFEGDHYHLQERR